MYFLLGKMNVFNIDNIRALDSNTVVTVGMFDGLHLGHRHLLVRLRTIAAKEKLDPWVVTFDAHPRKVLDPSTPMSLLSTPAERLTLLEACGVSNVAMIHFDKKTSALSACQFASTFLCDRLNMRVLLLGYDNMFGNRNHNDFDLLPEMSSRCGFKICRDEAVMLDGVEVSSTKIRKALGEGDMARANAMLGAPYRISGTVVHGRHVGTSLGYPTANIVIDESKMLPAQGVYALRACVDGRFYPAMANMGPQPTFGTTKPILEVHIIGYEGDLYSQVVSVEFMKRIRDIRQFGTPDELRRQLSRDKDECVSIVNL